jgi:cystathionine beta-lyase
VDFDKAVSRRGTGSIKWDTIPDGVIGLSIADADWQTAPPVLDAVRGLLAQEPVFGYGFNDYGLVESVRSWYERRYGLAVKAEWILPIPGIVPAFGILARLADGDVLIAEPGYSMMLAAPERAGKRALRTRLREESSGAVLSYRYDFDDLEQKANGGAGAFFLCNPHNPIGYSYERDELKRLAGFARRKKLVTVSDEIHCELCFDKPHIPWFDVEPENSVTLIAPGKVCNMPGIPGALAVVPDETLRERVKRAFGRVSLGALNCAAIAGAFGESADAWKAEQLAYLKANRDYLAAELPRRLPKARFTRNESAYLQWVDLSDYALGDAVRFLRENARVALAGGGEFGGTEGCVRINFATRRATLAEALDRIEMTVAERAELARNGKQQFQQ